MTVKNHLEVTPPVQRKSIRESVMVSNIDLIHDIILRPECGRNYWNLA